VPTEAGVWLLISAIAAHLHQPQVPLLIFGFFSFLICFFPFHQVGMERRAKTPFVTTVTARMGEFALVRIFAIARALGLSKHSNKQKKK
jgi:hypothetical protein